MSILFYLNRTAPRLNWRNGWKTTTSLIWSRRALATVAVNGFLYAVAGMDSQGNYVKPVEYAPILKDKTLGQWQGTSALNQGRFYLATVALNGYLYALGGAKGSRGAGNIPIASGRTGQDQLKWLLGSLEL